MSGKFSFRFVFTSCILFSSLILAQVTPSEALKLLEQGNKRFVIGSLSSKTFATERDEQRKGQHPYAIILTCADSRLPPEIIFDESLGKLFVVRVAGNVIDDVVLGSIEYAAEHLHVQLLMILGHTSCGAVKATLEGGEFGKNIGSLVERIKPAVSAAKGKSRDKSIIFQLAVESNVDEQMEVAFKDSKILQELIHEKKFLITGGIYNIESGEVNFFEAPVQHETEVKQEVKSEKSENEKGQTEEKKETENSQKGHTETAKNTEDQKLTSIVEAVITEYNTQQKNSKENKEKGSTETPVNETPQPAPDVEVKIKDNIYSINYKYFYQTGSFLLESNAEAEVKKLKKLKKTAFISTIKDEKGNKTWYRVRVGFFDSLEEAEANLKAH